MKLIYIDGYRSPIERTKVSTPNFSSPVEKAAQFVIRNGGAAFTPSIFRPGCTKEDLINADRELRSRCDAVWDIQPETKKNILAGKIMVAGKGDKPILLHRTEVLEFLNEA